MKNLLVLVPFALASLVALASGNPACDCSQCNCRNCDCQIEAPPLASAPIARAADAKPYFDGRQAPAGAVATNGTSNAISCDYAYADRGPFMQRGPVRRAVAWLFRRRCR